VFVLKNKSSFTLLRVQSEQKKLDDAFVTLGFYRNTIFNDFIVNRFSSKTKSTLMCNNVSIKINLLNLYFFQFPTISNL
jgi:hypothetical protein